MTVGAKRLADEINEEHRLAQASYAEHAIRCGQLLLEQRRRVGHGNFGTWLADNCNFKRSTATRYMIAAKRFAMGVAISSVSAVFPSGRTARKAIGAEKPSEANKTSARIKPERKSPPASRQSVSPASASKERSVEDAIKALITRTGARHNDIINAVRNARSRVTKFSKQLIEAKNDLARAEAAVLKAAREATR